MGIEDYVVHLARLSLAGQRRDVVTLVRRMAWRCRDTHPDISAALTDLLRNEPAQEQGEEMVRVFTLPEYPGLAIRWVGDDEYQIVRALGGGYEVGEYIEHGRVRELADAGEDFVFIVDGYLDLRGRTVALTPEQKRVPNGFLRAFLQSPLRNHN